MAVLKRRVADFVDERGWHPPAKNLAVSIVIEAAELLEKFQWDGYRDYEKKSKAQMQEIADELADVLIYCLQFATECDIDIAGVVERKLKKNAKKYPAHLFRGNKNPSLAYYRLKKKHRKK